MSAKGLITFIDGVPLYGDKESALEWGKYMNVKGIHKHEWGGWEGYMGGVDHAAAIEANTRIMDVHIPKFKSKRKHSVPVTELNQYLSHTYTPTAASQIVVPTPQSVPQDVTDTVPGYNSGDPGGGGETTDPGGGGEGGY